MEFTVKEMRLLVIAIMTEEERRENKRTLSDRDKEALAILGDLGNRIDRERIRKQREEEV